MQRRRLEASRGTLALHNQFPVILSVGDDRVTPVPPSFD